jgi:hypothetical protein
VGELHFEKIQMIEWGIYFISLLPSDPRCHRTFTVPASFCLAEEFRFPALITWGHHRGSTKF